MINKIKLVCIFMVSLFFSFPVYAGGYGGVNVAKVTFQLIMYIIIFIAVIFMSLYGTKLVARNFKDMSNSKYVKVLDAMNIPGGSKIVITKVSNRIYILAIGNSGTNILDIIDEDEFPIIEDNFDNYLSKYLSKKNLNYNKMNGKIKVIFDKFNKKKDKEGTKNEKQD